MYLHFTSKGFIIDITLFFCLASHFILYAQARDIDITVHLRGIYESKISILALSGSKTFKPIAEVQGIKNGETTKLSVSKEYLPGEFVLRFDYKEIMILSPGQVFSLSNIPSSMNGGVGMGVGV
jgi:hypothetical protein